MEVLMAAPKGNKFALDCRPKEWRDVQNHQHTVVSKTEEQLREEILAGLEELGLFEEAGQLKAVG
jgi:hypothetical protein